ncbi:fetuin-B [Callorhinchus milii]|uniref:Fetuin-B-like n=1 Tax=Callorhinchus milii TaxID=7868 RepID=A0A4W3HXX1_CALMI|nr:fetuin-B [Callorhinchus milii]|eukprot:gi/632934043/ref/XP_007897454.1/ PREDICTED: fetuin-B-like [Callorhinchus milii]
MKALLVFVVWAQLSSSRAEPSPQPIAPLLLDSTNCNDSNTIKVSGLALQEINRNRREGYIYNLVSIRSALKQSQGNAGMVYYLTLGVDETECHVLSRKDWRSCESRMFHQSVAGECNATLHINNLERIVCLHDYNCSLTSADRRTVSEICPDCPIDRDDKENESSINSANKALTNYNQNSNNTKYFNLLNVTKYSFQGMFFEAHFVEFTIVETACSKKQTVKNLSKCKPLAPGVAQFGFCKASVQIVNMKDGTTVTCELYQPEEYRDLNHPDHCRNQALIEQLPRDPRAMRKGQTSGMPTFMQMNETAENLVVLPYFPLKRSSSSSCPYSVGGTNSIR